MLQGLAVLRAEAGSGANRGLSIRAQGQTVPAALLAVQFDRPASVVLEGGLVSYMDLATADTHDGFTLTIVPGVLPMTDLPELMARIAPVPVRLIRPRTPGGAVVTASTLPAQLGMAAPANVTLMQ